MAELAREWRELGITKVFTPPQLNDLLNNSKSNWHLIYEQPDVIVLNGERIRLTEPIEDQE